MAEPSVHGRFVWQELMTADPAGAAAFYGRLLGWHAHPSASDPGYTELGTDSRHVAGMMRLPDGARALWLPYVGVDDVDTTIAAAVKLGGKVTHPATDMPGVGRYATLADPQGAGFAIFKPAHAPAGPPSTPQPGEFAWMELGTSDHEAAFAFYRALFGWEVVQRMDMGPGAVYLVFGSGGVQRGGMYRLREQQAQRPHWLPYAEVANADAAAATAVGAGGRIVAGPMDVPGGGRIAQLLDPSGVLFAVHSSAAAAKVPRKAAAKQPAAASATKPAAKPAAVPAKAGAAAASKPAAAPAKAGGKRAARRKKPARKSAARKPAARKSAAKRAAPKRAAARKRTAKAARRPAKRASTKRASAKRGGRTVRRAAGKARRKK